MRSPFFEQADGPLVLGHRGVPKDHQENTMAGFRRAISLGLDGVELDVVLTKDQQLIVFHDRTTERLTGVPGNIAEMTWQEIQSLTIQPKVNVGNHVIDYGKEEKIPLLQDVLTETRGRLLVNIEIKAFGLDFQQRQTGKAVADLIREMGMASDVFVTSFNPWPLLWLKRTVPEVETGLIHSPDFVENKDLRMILRSPLTTWLMGASHASLNLEMFGRDTVERAHRHGQLIGAWTIFSHNFSEWSTLSAEQEIALIHELSDRGLDYFITDDPVRLRQTLE